MEFELERAREILERTPATLRAMLAGLPDEWVTATVGPDTWSPRDVLAHLIHCEEVDWMPRAHIILQHGEEFVFEPFDRFGFDNYATGKSTEELLTEFEALRIRNLDALEDLDLTDEQLALRGTHPEFGQVTMAQLIATWATHDLAHMVQIARTMAKQHDAAVGPWKKYLSVLQ